MRRLPMRCTAPLFLFLLASAALAGDPPRPPLPTLDIEFDKLKGDILRDRGEWLLRVRYEVEIEDPPRVLPALDLVVDVFVYGRPLIDDQGHPLQFVFPLDRPTEIEDDEIEFKGGAIAPLSFRSIIDPDEMEIIGRVMLRGDNRPLAVKEDDVSRYRPRPRFRFGCFGFGIGVKF